MAAQIDDRTILRAPSFTVQHLAGAVVALDPALPNWIATDERGLRILAQLDGRQLFADVVKRYGEQNGLDVARAWLHVETFARDAIRQGFVSANGSTEAPYLGRASYLTTDRLHELWIQVNDFCNLACEHCLVSSGPDRRQGLESTPIVDAVDQAVALGAERIFFTGGEPLARSDILQLVEHVVLNRARELVVLTNGTLFNGERLARLSELARHTGSVMNDSGSPTPRLRVQVSLDGSTPEVNDPIRGTGSFARIVAGIRAAVESDLHPTLTATILRHNLADLDGIVRLAASLGVRNVHLLWPHRRGRVLHGPFADLPAAAAILDAVRRTRQVATEVGVTIDNIEEFRLRLDGAPGIKNDLAGAGWNSLCLYTDGQIYPSPSMAGVPELRCGDLATEPLERIWKDSSVCRALREATVERKPICRTCSLKFLCGGGDVEHGYWDSVDQGKGSFVAHDPYCDVYKGLAADALADLAREGHDSVQPRSGYDRPIVLRGMGQFTLHDEEAIVRTTHSACVLSEEVLEKSRLTVREFYGHAAEQPQAELCCPIRPDDADLGHIPQEVVQRFYGCGSPVKAARLSKGETMVDLGSGAGIDCFIAAKHVGPKGHVFGIDMTAQMLSVAREYQPRVAAALGYDAVEFRRGFLEEIPVPDATADAVTSNCVINLSADKSRVLREIWRVLKDHGRMVVADIVSDRGVPPKMRADGQLWGECISGALTEEAFLAALERSGFYGISVLSKTFWREVQGCRFYSVTVRGYKFEKRAGCRYVGQHAVYLGPLKAAIDEEGHLFPRGTAVEVCTDTAAKLARAPYAASFVIHGTADSFGTQASGAPDMANECCELGSGCC